MNRKKWFSFAIGGLVCSLTLLAPNAEAKSKTIKVGSRITVQKGNESYIYTSSNAKIASVSSKGTVTGKKAGKVKIIAKKNGTKKTFSLKVKKAAKKPATLPITFEEVQIEKNGDNFVVKNKSKKVAIKSFTVKIEAKKYTLVPVETPVTTAIPAITETASLETVPPTSAEKEKKEEKVEVAFTASNIGAGKTAILSMKDENKENNYDFSEYKIIDETLIAGKAKYSYSASSNKYQFDWGTKDTVAPQITGYVKKNSYTGYGDTYRLYYSDRKNSYNFAKYVKASDNRDGKVTIKVDKSKINWSKSGYYRIYFTATDKAGNVGKSWAKVQVIVPGTPEKYADQVLNKITRKSWSAEKKARAIYRYVRGHMGYVQHSNHTEWRQSAVRALRYGSGDCYTYYSISRLLLSRAGIPNVMIRRYPESIGRHFWNLTYINGGWYHFDTTPRTRNAVFCLWTDQQLHQYSSGLTFSFRRDYLPKRSTKRI